LVTTVYRIAAVSDQRRWGRHDAHPFQIEARPLSENHCIALFYHIVVKPDLYLRVERKSSGDISMLRSPNLRRGNVPLAMRLKIDDLHAHLAPLDHYGLPGLSSAMTGGVRPRPRL
jgi:hypothetical protein